MTCDLESRFNVFHRNDGTSWNTSERVILNNKQICAELNLPFWFYCDHQLLQFDGVDHVGLLRSEEVKINGILCIMRSPKSQKNI